MSNSESLTTDEQIEHLRQLLANSCGHERQVIRPAAIIGMKEVAGRRFAEFGLGPITIVTFYITHSDSVSIDSVDIITHGARVV